jgi:hypothetical protein
LATETQLEAIIHCLTTQDVTASKFLISLLTYADFRDHPYTEELIRNTSEIFNAFLQHPKASESALEWANTVMKRNYAKDIKDLAHVQNGWHFGALHTSEDQLKDFRIEDMARDMQRLAPELWDLLGLMLSADRKEGRRQRAVTDRPVNQDKTDKDEDQMMASVEDDEDDMYWEGQDEFMMDEVDIVENGGTYHGPRCANRNVERRKALITIV